jgi:ABC-2 type transport system permease protein
MVLGKLLGGTLIALVQALVFLALGLAVGLKFTLISVPAISVFLFVLSLALTGLGFVIAWRMDSTQGFHAIMSVFLMPMWLLSGAFFPASAGWLGLVVRLNPLTYGVAGLRRLLYWSSVETLPAELPSSAVCWSITGLFAAVTLVLSWRVAAYRTTGDLL